MNKSKLDKSKDLVKKIKFWLKFYWLGFLLISIFIALILLTLTLSNMVSNLQETLLIASIFSPYLILYVQNVRKRKEVRNSLIYLYTRILYLVGIIQINAEITEKIREYWHDMILLPSIEQSEIKEFSRKVQNLIIELRGFNYNVLIKFGCVIINPENYNFILLHKYDIGIMGIQNLKEDIYITTDKMAVDKISNELEKLI